VLFIRPLRQRPGLLRKKAQEMVDQYSSFLDVSLVSLGLGKELYEQADALKEPLDALRQRIALEIGIVMPEIRVNHSSRCASFAYSIKMREVAVYHGEVDGINEGKDHIFQIIAKLRALIVTQAWQLLGYSEVEALLDRMKKYNPSLYKELFPRYFTVPALRFVLRNLLREGISIRDLSKILEIIKDNLHRTRDPDLLTEFVRAAFAPYLCNKYKNDEGYIEALLLDPVIETMVINSIKESSQVRWLDLTPEDGLRLLTSLGDEMKKNQEFGLNPVLLCSPGLRRFLKRLLETSFPDLPVLSYNEIAPFSEVRSVGMVK
jgi:flagellar biosynthesis component FlhA